MRMDIRTFFSRCKKSTAFKVSLLTILLFVCYKIGRLYNPCEEADYDFTLHQSDIDMVGRAAPPTNPHSRTSHDAHRRISDLDLNSAGVHETRKLESRPGQVSHARDEFNQWKSSSTSWTPFIAKTPPLSSGGATAAVERSRRLLYTPRDLYGTGSIWHHRELKSLGFESTSKHAFKSPYIKDPHIYTPQTIRKAPGVRQTKVISCYNCPERFYLSQRKNYRFTKCPYSECRLTQTDGPNPEAAVLIFWQDPEVRPPPRPPGQAWAYMSWETPPHRTHPTPRELWQDQINWTISYRQDADFILPYDVLVWRDSSLIQSDDFYLQMAKMKTKTAVWWVSHCQTRAHREQYVREMQKYIDVDIFGACTNRTCDRAYVSDCYSTLNDTYHFYLSFENSHCVDYVTEKFFKVFRFRYNVIPVARGAFDYDKFFPTDILINAERFGSAKELALYLKELTTDHERYARMLKEKDRLASRRYKMDWCDFCEKLHTGRFKSRVIHDVKDFTDEGGKCFDKVVKDGIPLE